MEDIGKELCERVREVFEQRNSSNAFLVRLKDEIARGTATMRDTSLYSQTLGINLRRAIKEVVTLDELPDSTLYYNIAHSILEPLLRDTYEDVNAVCAEVQRKLDDKAGIHLAPQKADFPAERVRAAAGSASTRDTPAHGIEVLERTSENITAAFSDDYMKANADFRSRAGLDTYIERRDDGKCCEWCSRIAGRYSYPDKAPRDIFRRHDNCGCTVEYVCSKGRQDVWSKRWRDDQGKAERIAYADGAEKPTKLSGKEAEELEKRLTAEKNRGIINLKDSGEAILPEIANKASKIDFFDNEDLNVSITKAANQLLEELRKHSQGTEIAYIIGAEPPHVISLPIIGEEGAMAVQIPRSKIPSITLHNHPSGHSFSAMDIDRFVVDEKARAMCVIGNDGSWYILEKTDSFDWITYGYSVIDFSNDDRYAEIVLEGAEKYGFKYYKKNS